MTYLEYDRIAIRYVRLDTGIRGIMVVQIGTNRVKSFEGLVRLARQFLGKDINTRLLGVEVLV